MVYSAFGATCEFDCLLSHNVPNLSAVRFYFRMPPKRAARGQPKERVHLQSKAHRTKIYSRLAIALPQDDSSHQGVPFFSSVAQAPLE